MHIGYCESRKSNGKSERGMIHNMTLFLCKIHFLILILRVSYRLTESVNEQRPESEMSQGNVNDNTEDFLKLGEAVHMMV